jgi:leucyl-tRNA---protein transferase
MIEDIHYPQTRLTGEQLDSYLNAGWFRMQQRLFTTHFIFDGNHILPVFWLRIRLAKVNWGATQKKILKANSQFKVAVKPAIITYEIECLYQTYRQSLDFEISESLKDLLNGDQSLQIFDTRMVEVRDGEKLIAIGIFDEGKDTIAGIINFYHPDYRRKSLGKLLMIKKTEYAVESNKTFYYPGYISTGTTKFDYKLMAGGVASEVLIHFQNRWMTYEEAAARKLMTSIWNL